eukprot:CAMPEP_0114601502 /NCGR_PEP_ID=MMETSP0125-20121206/24138_1 /TAXON_ID=485358 ORGANISM="Aristerostoma sp., Strain ATCC 50986" /NCGR_SAMPLE_ID=MMETSP0125 /ASSEMBLY_ACC=CAM_ASM_000245 /LENGTH=100 /DNA_ID=CAMNT_0001810829 /DNA_START=1651 /DNA_END=1950 /DNA_ORIENTATION=-
MNYNWGRLDDFIARIKLGSFVNACDAQIMHAKYGSGVLPGGVLYTNSTDSSFRALMINEHVNFDLLPTIIRTNCGAPLPSSYANENEVDVNIFNMVDPNL